MPAKSHGLSTTKQYLVWQKMKDRCQNIAAKDYPKYGGRGISLCERWSTYENFLADMGPRPSDLHSIDRIDNDGNYEPSNCRWATRQEQQQNTQQTTFVTFRGQRMSFADAWRASGSSIKLEAARSRIQRGWEIEMAFSKEITPNQQAAMRERGLRIIARLNAANDVHFTIAAAE
jgi:hypothetical protein